MDEDELREGDGGVHGDVLNGCACKDERLRRGLCIGLLNDIWFMIQLMMRCGRGLLVLCKT